MPRLQKVFLALTALVLAGAGTASAQNCHAFIPVGGAGNVGSEGATELLPTLQLTCDGATVGAVTVTLFSSAPFATNPATGKVDATVTATVSSAGATFPSTSVTLPSPNTLVAFIDFSPTAPLDGVVFTGVRVNAGSLPNGSPVTMFAYSSIVTGPGTTTTVSTTPSIPVAFVSPSNLTPVVVGGPNVAACAGTTKTTYPVATVTLQEAFPSAYKDASDIIGGSSVSITQGMRLAVTFNNLAQGVNYYVPAIVKGSGSLSLTAYSSATASSPATTSSITVGGVSIPAVGFSVSPGGTTIYYGVTADNPALVENATFTLYETPVAPVFAQSNQGGLVPIHQAPLPVTVSVVPVTTGAVYPVYSATAPAPTGTQAVVAGSNGILLTCETTMVFPFVTNQLGFDTGFALSNPSPGGGACFLNFFGSGAPIPSTGIPLPSGTQSSGAAANLLSSVVPGFQGTMVAACDFPGAQGFGFLSYSLGQNDGAAEGYIATVINNNGIPVNSTY